MRVGKDRSDYELLAPAGSFDSLKAAYEAGADAAYMGGLKFGARAYADSTGEDCISAAIDYAHLRDKKLYLTVNTLFKEEELKGELYSYILPYYEQGLDAVIVQDMGVMSFLHKEFPELPLHASTQMTITGGCGARWAKDMGASRIVTAREMSFQDIKDISDNVDIEIEAFVHGAMCYCYSGQCLMSSLIGGRSGNRGRCAQPCRLPYDVFNGEGRCLTERGNNYILSLKDMCTIDMLPQLMEAGVMSFKIEGRMKSPLYTAGVVSIYRKYIDMYLEKGINAYKVSQSDKDKLIDLFDRGGQTDGYLKGIKGKSMMALKEKPAYREIDAALVKDIEERFISSEHKIKVTGQAEFIIGNPAKLSLSVDNTVINVESGVVSEALNRPMTEDELVKRLRKTGGTEYVFDKLTVHADDNIFISVKDLNELRRSAFASLEVALLSKYKRTIRDTCGNVSELQDASCDVPEFTKGSCEDKAEVSYKNVLSEKYTDKMLLNAYVETEAQLDAVLKSGVVDTVYLDSAAFPPKRVTSYVKHIHAADMKCIYVMPSIFKREVKLVFERYFAETAYLFDGVAVKNIDEAQWLIYNVPGVNIVGEASLYAYNSGALDFYRSKGIDKFIMPQELNFGELNRASHINNEIVVYGRTAVMVTEQCIQKNTSGCTKKPGILSMKDRKQMVFPVKNKCEFCYNVIYNSVQTSLLSCKDKVLRLTPSAVRLDFTDEDGKTVKDIINLYYKAFIAGDSVDIPTEKFTKGHFLRGIE